MREGYAARLRRSVAHSEPRDGDRLLHQRGGAPGATFLGGATLIIGDDGNHKRAFYQVR